MPALDSNVTAFLTQVKNDLSSGPFLDQPTNNIKAAPINFCKAQDIANVLRLLRDACEADTFLDAEISAIMGGKSPSTQQYIGQSGGNEYLITDAFKKLIEFAGGTLPFTAMITTTALAGASTTAIAIDLRGGACRIDEFRGFVIEVDGVRRIVVSNTADGVVTVDKAITAPSGGESVVVGLAHDFLGNTARPKYGAGGQPGDNYRLAEMIQVAQDAVIAYVIPG